MINHIILWKLRDTMSDEEKKKAAADIKKNLEALQGNIPGLIKIKVNANPLPSSNADVMLDSVFENIDALKVYQTHEKHLYVANTYVRPYTQVRMCMDFEK